MANRPAPAKSGMLKPRTEKTIKSIDKSKTPPAKMPTPGAKSKRTGTNTSSGAVSYGEAKAKLKKMMRGGM